MWKFIAVPVWAMALAAAWSLASEAAHDRPACPEGWSDFKNPVIGVEAHVPPGYWVRLHGGVLLTVEKQDDPSTLAFLVPLVPRPGAQAAEIADKFVQFVAQSDPQLKSRIIAQPSPDRAMSEFTSTSGGQAVEGRFCTILAAGGSMAFIIGVKAPRGRLDGEMPTLEKIAQGFGFTPPSVKWVSYQSPAGGFTMNLPQGWQVQNNDGQTPKDNIDWAAADPAKPLSRAFQWCPRYCSAQLLQDPLHALRGYQAAEFRGHDQVVAASLGQISQNTKLLKMEVNQPLTELLRAMNQQVAQLIAGLGAGQSDVVVYNCLADANVDGREVKVAFIAGIQTLALNAGISGTLIDLSVTLRGWCAEPEQFVNDSPVLEKVCASMQLTPAFINRIVQNNAHASKVIRETYDHISRIDNEIRDSRWKTMDAIAEMNYDNMRDYGGYVNENTGRIEQIDPEKLVRNSSNEIVSREEVEAGVSPDQATVLRGAFSQDYMKGVYGRIEF